MNGGYVSVKNSILSTDSVEGVVNIFQNKFERCNPYYCMENQRISYAYNILASH
jgi:hypothetical protein